MMMVYLLLPCLVPVSMMTVTRKDYTAYLASVFDRSRERADVSINSDDFMPR